MGRQEGTELQERRGDQVSLGILVSPAAKETEGCQVTVLLDLLGHLDLLVRRGHPLTLKSLRLLCTPQLRT